MTFSQQNHVPVKNSTYFDPEMPQWHGTQTQGHSTQGTRTQMQTQWHCCRIMLGRYRPQKTPDWLGASWTIEPPIMCLTDSMNCKNPLPDMA